MLLMLETGGDEFESRALDERPIEEIVNGGMSVAVDAWWSDLGDFNQRLLIQVFQGKGTISFMRFCILKCREENFRYGRTFTHLPWARCLPIASRQSVQRR